MKNFYGFLYKIALVWSIAAMLYFVANEQGWFDPKPVKISANVSEATQMTSDWADFIMSQLFWWSLTICVALVALGLPLRFLLLPAIKDFQSYDVGENGLYRPRMRVSDTWLGWLNPFRETEHEITNPNMQIAPAMRTRRSGNFYDMVQHTGEVPLHDQMRVAEKLANAPIAAAASGMIGGKGRGKAPTQNHYKAQAGVFNAQADRESAKAEKAQLDAEISRKKLLQLTEGKKPAEPVDPNETITLESALQAARQTPGIIQLGQSENAERTIATLNLNVTPHAAVFGGTNSGKTSNAAFTISLAALVWRWPVIVFEYEEKSDWKLSFGDHIEHFAVNGETVVDALELIRIETARRAEIISRANVRDYRELDGMEPWLFVFEEFGTTRDDIEIQRKAGRAASKAFDTMLGNLMRAGRNTGLHVLFVDQYPDAYEKPVRINIGARIVYKLGDPSFGHASGSSMNFKLKEQGQFDIRKVDTDGKPIFFNSFLCTKDAYMDQLLTQLQKPSPILHMNTIVSASVSPVSNGVSGNVSPVSKKTAETLPPERNAETFRNDGGGNGENVPIPLLRNWKRFGSLELLAEKYYEIYPDGTQAVFRRYISELAPDMTSGSIRKNAFNLHHTYSPKGSNYDQRKTE